MVEVARLVGTEKRSYRGQDGQEKFFCGLHLLYLEGSVNGVQGSKVESVSCPRELNPGLLQVGGLYQLDCEMYNTRNGKAARLVNLLPVEEPGAKK